jgi:hypothetical protein
MKGDSGRSMSHHSRFSGWITVSSSYCGTERSVAASALHRGRIPLVV